MYLNYFSFDQKILSSILDHLGRRFEFYCLRYQFFLFQIEETCTFIEISSKGDIKAENSSTLCKFHKRRKGLRPMGSNPDRVFNPVMLYLIYLFLSV